MIFGRNKSEPFPRSVRHKVAGENHPTGSLQMKDIMGIRRTGRMHGLNAARKVRPRAVSEIGPLPEGSSPPRREDLGSKEPAVPPGRALVTGRGRENGSDRLEGLEMSTGKRKWIDEYRSLTRAYSKAVAFIVDPIIMHRKTPNAGRHIRTSARISFRFRHVVNTF